VSDFVLSMKVAALCVAVVAVFATASENEEDSLESLGITVDAAVEAGAGSATDSAATDSVFSPLYTLTDSNFSDFVNTSPLVLVEL
jgi:hypothetical protein